MKTYQLYDGQIQLQFDPGEHKYYCDNKQVANMTSIVGIIGNKSAMANWAAKMCKLKFLELVMPNEEYSLEQLEDIAKSIQKAPNQTRDKAGDIGTLVHEYIENYIEYGIKPKTDVKEELNAFNQFVDWYEATCKNLTMVSLERKVFSMKYNYTGTADALFKDEDGNYIMYDWKTSSGIYHGYLLQVAGYAMAIEEELGIEIKKGVIANFPKKGKMKLCEYDIDSSMRDCFLACLKLYQLTERKV